MGIISTYITGICGGALASISTTNYTVVDPCDKTNEELKGEKIKKDKVGNTLITTTACSASTATTYIHNIKALEDMKKSVEELDLAQTYINSISNEELEEMCMELGIIENNNENKKNKSL